MEQDGTKKSGWKTCLTIGCSALLLIGIAIGVVVAMNWKDVSEGFGKATSMVSGLMKVQQAVQQHVGAGDARVHLNSVSGVEGTTLRIELGSPGFLGDLDEASPEAREKARELAVVARDALPPEITPTRYQIVYTRRVKVGLTVTQSQTYVFDTAELPAPVPR